MAVRTYELLVILDPVRTEEQQKESIDKLSEVISKYAGETTKVDVWGKRRLAYLINKRREGYYVSLQFSADSEAKTLSELDRHCKYSDEIIRHLVTVAVVGKSVGNPALDREREERNARMDARGGGRPGGRPRRDFVPAPAEASAPVEAPVEAAPTTE